MSFMIVIIQYNIILCALRQVVAKRIILLVILI